MKVEYMKCDCCGRERVKTMKVKLPILTISYDLNNKEVLIPVKLDICEECAKVIAKTYYKQAEEYGYTGVKCTQMDGYIEKLES